MFLGQVDCSFVGDTQVFRQLFDEKHGKFRIFHNQLHDDGHGNQAHGTWLKGSSSGHEIFLGKIKAVAAKDNITAIKIKSSRMLLAHGFLRKVFEIFESYQTPIDMVCTSEVGVSMSIDNTKHLNEIVNDLKKYGTVTVDHDMCIVCVVGDLEWENVGFEAKALDAMREIPVRMISFGGSNYNISFLIRESDKKQALQSLSNVLFNGKEK